MVLTDNAETVFGYFAHFICYNLCKMHIHFVWSLKISAHISKLF